MSQRLIKVCGIKDDQALDAALAAEADMIGFVFHERSPRHLSFERAFSLATRMGSRARRVALTVDADDGSLDAIVAAARPDILQLHGKETPERVATVRRRFGLPVMRALPVGSRQDLAGIAAFDAVADYLLFDAPAPATSPRPGGNGATFDWTLLGGVVMRTPWLLAGGLNAANVANALAITGADGVDVSSGVERAPGVKDVSMIAAFVMAARNAQVPRGQRSLPAA